MAAAVARGINLRDVGADRIGIIRRRDDDRGGPRGRLPRLRCPEADRAGAARHPRRAVADVGLPDAPDLPHEPRRVEMMRYMRRLSDRDLALDRAMIPLGSCTMKLNAAVEMMPITWPEFGAIHPFAPADQAEGYAEMIEDLPRGSARSPAMTRCRCSPIPARRANMRASDHRGLSSGARRLGRKVCLIPVSAHGTNPASAHMAGWRWSSSASPRTAISTWPISRAKAEAAGDRLAAA
jgi:glycine dehydrogenase